MASGDQVQTHDGKAIVIKAVSSYTKETTVYNLSVANLNNFYVGDDGVLVHNANCVYQSVNTAGEVNYVWITNNITSRAAQHARQKGISINEIPGLNNLSRSEARAVEQVLIEAYGLGKNGGSLLNRINSIAATNPAYAFSLVRGNRLLQQAGYF